MNRSREGYDDRDDAAGVVLAAGGSVGDGGGVEHRDGGGNVGAPDAAPAPPDAVITAVTVCATGADFTTIAADRTRSLGSVARSLDAKLAVMSARRTS